jgi:hypothetical protein
VSRRLRSVIRNAAPVATALCLAGAAGAWSLRTGDTKGVLAKSTLGRESRWVKEEIVLEPSTVESAVPPAVLQSVLLEGARTWNDRLEGCGVPRLRVAAARDAVSALKRDGRSSVVVRQGSWCPDGARDTADCHAPDRAAVTHLYPNDTGARHSELREADVEINAVYFRWTRDGDASSKSLRALVMHELGHVLGLDHPCEGGGGSGGPACTAAERSALMYPEPVEPGREAVLEPTRGEVRALCSLYSGR